MAESPQEAAGDSVSPGRDSPGRREALAFPSKESPSLVVVAPGLPGLDFAHPETSARFDLEAVA